jgi:hypothetical protein
MAHFRAAEGVTFAWEQQQPRCRSFEAASATVLQPCLALSLNPSLAVPLLCVGELLQCSKEVVDGQLSNRRTHSYHIRVLPRAKRSRGRSVAAVIGEKCARAISQEPHPINTCIWLYGPHSQDLRDSDHPSREVAQSPRYRISSRDDQQVWLRERKTLACRTRLEGGSATSRNLGRPVR